MSKSQKLLEKYHRMNESDKFQEIVKAIENARHGDIPSGLDELTYFFAEVWNGGAVQYFDNIGNGHISAAISFTEKFAPELASKMRELKVPSTSSRDPDYEVDGEEDTELDKFDTWFYNNDDKFEGQMYDYLKKTGFMK